MSCPLIRKNIKSLRVSSPTRRKRVASAVHKHNSASGDGECVSYHKAFIIFFISALLLGSGSSIALSVRTCLIRHIDFLTWISWWHQQEEIRMATVYPSRRHKTRPQQQSKVRKVLFWNHSEAANLNIIEKELLLVQQLNITEMQVASSEHRYINSNTQKAENLMLRNSLLQHSSSTSIAYWLP